MAPISELIHGAWTLASGVFLLSRSKILRTTQTGDERPPAQAAAAAD